MKVRIVPHLKELGKEESGIRRVIESHFRHLRKMGVELAEPGDSSFDVLAVHATSSQSPPDVSHTHGLYWTADYNAASWEWQVNRQVIENIRRAKIVTVPSSWVAETFQRDMHLNPEIVPHGIEWEDWQEVQPAEPGGYVLWNKNRDRDVCDPSPMIGLAHRFPSVRFVSTFGNNPPPNVTLTGIVEHRVMRSLVAGAAIYLSTTKETFGIGTLEAMACGVPVLGFAHGGNLDLVKHGETGYLAQPGNMDDLAQGFEWCMKYRSDLGEAAREVARLWTWERTAEKLIRIYENSLDWDPPTVTIVIPSFNYGEKVSRAIRSASEQTFNMLTAIVVVDDGSDDGGLTERVVREWTEKDRRVQYIRQANQGVANARNNGIASVRSKYYCCLDADDAIEPDFLSACIGELEKDRSLGIAYTRLRWIKPDGTDGISDWPGEFNYDMAIRGQNQIPTCCVFRRQIWERLGGYRQRYAPGGAGSEDAEFWLRAGSIGFGAKLASQKPMFVYSWLSGRVTSDPDYKEVNWRELHPWTQDGLHPFASVAKPKRMSHPVREYDEPLVSVVIGLGPGHEKLVIDALDSLEAQTFRNWEAIVVCDGAWKSGKYSTADQFMPDEFYSLQAAFPFVHFLVDTTDQTLVDGKFKPKPRGTGAARNLGVNYARAPFILFLDADDWLYPEAIQKMLDTWTHNEGIIYTDYVGKVMNPNFEKLAPDLQSRVYAYDEKQDVAIIGYKGQDFDPDRAQRQPEDPQPWIWSTVTMLVPKLWHDEIGGFDETMEAWEDVDYQYRLARAGRCYYRVPEELFVYRFYTGSRRDLGLQAHAALIEYMRQKYREVPLMPCNCGGNGRVRTSSSPVPISPILTTTAKEAIMQDQDMVKIRYNSANRGQHRVVGPETRTDYGYRKQGDEFLVHRSDIARNPTLFTEIDQYVPPVQSVVPPAPPRAVAPPAPPAPRPATPPEAPPAPTIERSPEETPEASIQAPVFDVAALPGVTPAVASQLIEAGVDNVDKFLELGIEGLKKFRGVGEFKAAQIIDAVNVLKRMAEAEPEA